MLLLIKKNIFHFFIFFLYFFMKFSFSFFMFRDVPECSGMFRNVPFSGVYRRPSCEAWIDDSLITSFCWVTGL